MIDISVEYHSGIPVYKQIISAIISAIQLGELPSGEKLPSIRELSVKLDINPNTTAKVYRELELRGVIESKAGSGSFVLPQEKEMISDDKKKSHLKALLNNLLNEARKYQISENEVMSFIKEEVNS